MRVFLPDIFEGQPRVVTAAVLIWYVIVGPLVTEQLPIARPKFPWKEFSYISCSLVVSLSLSSWSVIYVPEYHILKLLSFFFVFFMSTCAFVLLLRKPYVTLFITLYQRRAPSSVRLRCKQSPSCSEYMKIAIIKYGWINGSRAGWGRMTNCTGQEKTDEP